MHELPALNVILLSCNCFALNGREVMLDYISSREVICGRSRESAEDVSPLCLHRLTDALGLPDWSHGGNSSNPTTIRGGSIGQLNGTITTGQFLT
uniref:Uncharacterized protein n=1 Tax=Timema poppense TaxID=170557 RepID=A0A7R9DKT1_TIMPO|nr:unnamed protein product [Timema poppensis]